MATITSTLHGCAVAYLDPDFRPNPKTNTFCYLCQKDIKGEPAGFIHVVGGGFMALAVADEDRWNAEHRNDPGDMGSFPIGPDCAKKLPRGFVHPVVRK